MRKARGTLFLAPPWSGISFVPTMGALHEGHLSLMRLVKESADDHLVVSVFVNPTQFGENEDLSSYPRDLERDAALCESVGCDILFCPSVDEMYGDAKTTVTVAELTDRLCGASRPGHFDGVTTVVTKLFNIVQPDVAVFGQKDYQQLATIRKMVVDLNFPIEIVGAPIVREPDGLALSSRNVRLTPAFRSDAVALSRGLFAARDAFVHGARDVVAIKRIVRDAIEKTGTLSIDYVDAVDPDTLLPLSGDADRVTLLAAIFAGDVRLIDNITLG